MAYSISLSVLLVLQAAFWAVSAGLPRRVESPYGINQASSENEPILGRLLVWRRNPAGQLALLGCVKEDGWLAYQGSLACRKPMHAVYQTPTGAVLRTSKKPQRLCGMFDGQLACPRSIGGDKPPATMYLNRNNFSANLNFYEKDPIAFQGLPGIWGTDGYPTKYGSSRLFTKAQRDPAVDGLLIYWFPWPSATPAK